MIGRSYGAIQVLWRDTSKIWRESTFSPRDWMTVWRDTPWLWRETRLLVPPVKYGDWRETGTGRRDKKELWRDSGVLA